MEAKAPKVPEKFLWLFFDASSIGDNACLGEQGVALANFLRDYGVKTKAIFPYTILDEAGNIPSPALLGCVDYFNATLGGKARKIDRLYQCIDDLRKGGVEIIFRKTPHCLVHRAFERKLLKGIYLKPLREKLAPFLWQDDLSALTDIERGFILEARKGFEWSAALLNGFLERDKAKDFPHQSELDRMFIGVTPEVTGKVTPQSFDINVELQRNPAFVRCFRALDSQYTFIMGVKNGDAAAAMPKHISLEEAKKLEETVVKPLRMGRADGGERAIAHCFSHTRKGRERSGSYVKRLREKGQSLVISEDHPQSEKGISDIDRKQGIDLMRFYIDGFATSIVFTEFLSFLRDAGKLQAKDEICKVRAEGPKRGEKFISDRFLNQDRSTAISQEASLHRVLYYLTGIKSLSAPESDGKC